MEYFPYEVRGSLTTLYVLAQGILKKILLRVSSLAGLEYIHAP